MTESKEHRQGVKAFFSNQEKISLILRKFYTEYEENYSPGGKKNNEEDDKKVMNYNLTTLVMEMDEEQKITITIEYENKKDNDLELDKICKMLRLGYEILKMGIVWPLGYFTFELCSKVMKSDIIPFIVRDLFFQIFNLLYLS